MRRVNSGKFWAGVILTAALGALTVVVSTDDSSSFSGTLHSWTDRVWLGLLAALAGARLGDLLAAKS